MKRKPRNASRRAYLKSYSLKSGVTGPNRTILAEYQTRAKGVVSARDGFDSVLKSMRRRMGEQAFERYLQINPITAERYVRNICTLVGDWDVDRFIVLRDDWLGRYCLYWNGLRVWIVRITDDHIYKSVRYGTVESAKWYYENNGIIWKEKVKHVDLMQEVSQDRYPEST
jgi:hypothetical protein